VRKYLDLDKNNPTGTNKDISAKEVATMLAFEDAQVKAPDGQIDSTDAKSLKNMFEISLNAGSGSYFAGNPKFQADQIAEWQNTYLTPIASALNING